MKAASVVGEVEVLPSLARWGLPKPQKYVVCRPDLLRAGQRIARDATVKGAPGRAGIIAAIALALAVALGVLALQVVDGGVLAFLIGATVGFVLGSSLRQLPWLLGGPPPSPDGAVVTIDARQSRAWRLCALVDDIAGTDAWTRGLLDPQGQIPGLLWRAVNASIALERAEEDVAKAKEFASLDDVVEGRAVELAELASSVDHIESALAAIHAAGLRIDDRRRALEDFAAKDREEQALLVRLSGQLSDGAQDAIDPSVPESMRVEVEELDEMLRAGDRALSEFRLP